MKRMKRLGLLTFLLCCIMFAVLLSGCSGDDTPDESSAVSESGSVSESETAGGEPDDPDKHVCKGESWVVESEATCDTDGKEVFKCSCGKTVKTKKLPALGHDKVTHEAKAATCDEDGWDAYETCTRCDYTTYAKIAALGHAKELREAKEPTCDEVGWDAYEVCSREGCDYSTYAEAEIPALGHDTVQYEALAATCDTHGWDAYETCTRCDYTTYAKIEALGHDMATVLALAPTCDDEGYNKHQECTRGCGHTVGLVVKPALGHDTVSHPAKEATCLVAGHDAYETCTRCDYTTRRGEDFFADHSYNEDEMCKWCVKVYGSQGLEYFTNGDGTCSLAGIGECEDTVLEIPYKAPNGDVVTGIAAGAFKDCTSLTKVRFNPRRNFVASIGAGAFEGCTALEEIEASEKIRSIGKNAFLGCDALLKDTAGVLYVNKWVVGATPALTNAAVSAGTVLIADGAFEGCAELTEAVIPESVIRVGFGAFKDCAKLASITLPFVGETANGNENTHFGYVFGASSYLGNGDAVPAKLVTVTLTAADRIPANAFNSCKNIKTVTVSSELVFLGEGAFRGASKLSALTLTILTAEEIGAHAFDGCAELTGFYFPEGLKTIGEGAFTGCANLTEIVLPVSVVTVGEGAFTFCSALESITVAEENEKYKAVDHCLIEVDTKTLIAGCKNSVIPQHVGLIAIAPDVFRGCTSLEVATLPDTLETIGSGAFRNCTNLTEIALPATLKTVGAEAFRGCSKLATVALGAEAQLQTIGDSAFEGCKLLVSFRGPLNALENEETNAFEIPASVTYIGANAFSGCEKLASLTIEENSQLVTIGERAFNGCKLIAAIKIPAGVKKVGIGAFAGCDALTTITVEPGNETYEDIENCLIEVATKTLIAGCKNSTIPGNQDIEHIGDGAFMNCSTITSITIPATVKTIGDDAFSGCKNAVFSFEGVSQLETIGKRAFVQCAKFGAFKAPKTLKSIGDGAFSSCGRGLTLVEFAADGQLESIGADAFEKCASFTTLTIPASVKTIGDHAFKTCARLATVEFAEGSQLESIGMGAFIECTRLTSITLPFVGNIKNGAENTHFGYVFTNQDGEISIPNTLKTVTVTGTGRIADGAFANCSNLNKIVVSGNVSSIGLGAFEGCSKLEIITLPFVGKTANGAENTHFGYVFGAENAADNGTVLPTSLTTVIIVGGEELAEGAFDGCATLTTIELPATLKTIERYAFRGCTELIEIEIPAGVERIGGGVFAACSKLATVTVSDENTKYIDVGNCIVDDADNLLVAGCNASVIPTDGSVTAIAPYAFEGVMVTELVIPDQVESIGVGAFQGCDALVTVTLPFVGDTVNDAENTYFGYVFGVDNAALSANLKKVIITGGTTLAESAFDGCATLTTIELPATLKTIERYAFRGCTELIGIVIPAGVERIGGGVFASCPNLTSVTVDGENEIYKSVQNCIIQKEDGILVAGCNGAQIPTDGSVTKIAAGAFEGTGITSVIIPAGITSLGDGTFKNCAALESVIFEDGSLLESIGADTFAGCVSLTSFTVPTGVTAIGEGAFAGCTAMTEIIVPFVGNTLGGTENTHFAYIFGVDNTALPEALKTVVITGGEKLPAGAFDGCATLTEITLPATLTGIGDHAFRGCAALTAIEIPASVTSIGNAAFNSCSSLATVTVASENGTYTAIGNCLIEIASKTLIAGCKNSVIPTDGSVTKIAPYAFEGCTSLTGIVIPDTVTEIGYGAFKGCESLESITLPYVGTSEHAHFGYVFGADDNSLVPQSLKSVTVTGGTSIASGAFADCANITGIALPASIQSIGLGAFRGCAALEEIALPFIGNGATQKHLGYVFGAETADQNAEFVPASLTSIAVLGGTAVAENAFANCYHIQNITLPTGIKDIGQNAFAGCSALTDVNTDALDSLFTVGEGAFENCSDLKKIVIPASVKTIGFGAFKGCVALEEITLPFVGNTKSGTENTHFAYIFGARAYYYGKDYVPATLRSVTVTGGTTVTSYAFWDCTSLKNVILPDTLTTIGYGAFYNCTSLESLTLPFVGNEKNGTENTYFGYIFGAWRSSAQDEYVPNTLTSVTVTGGSAIAEGAFAGCSKIKRLELSGDVTSIGFGAFKGCGALEEIKLPFVGNRADSTVNAHFGYVFGAQTPEEHSFFVPGTLQTVTVLGGTAIVDGAFRDCAQMATLTLPDGILTIGEGAFAGCSSLERFTIPATATSIGAGTFRGCSKLTGITVPASVKTIGEDAFAGCSKLGEVIFAENAQLTSIGANAFAGCAEITSLSIPAAVETIGARAFAGCSKLAMLTLASDGALTSIGAGAFEGCTEITSLEIPASVTEIGFGAFKGITELTSITLPFVGNVKNGESNTHFGYIFGAETASDSESFVPEKLESVILTDVTVIGDSAFAGCKKITSIALPEGVSSICENAFANCTKLTEIALPASVTSIGANAFKGCSALETLSIANGSVLEVVGAGAFENCKALTGVALPTTVTTVGNNAFKGCQGIETLTFGGDESQLEIIGNDAFNGCKALAGALAIPVTVKTIGDGAFKGCVLVTDIDFGDGSMLTSIGAEAFSGCSKIEEITIPANIEFLGAGAFAGCAGLTSIEGSPENTRYKVVTGCLIEVATGTLILGCNASTIPQNEGITSIAPGAFMNCSTITSITIPATVKTIGDDAFSGCKNAVFSFEGVSQLEAIGKRAFAQCAKFGEFKAPKTLKSIGDGAFSSCGRGLTLVEFAADGQLESIGAGAFEKCASFTTLTIPASVKTIGDNAFKTCALLATVEFAEGSQLESIGVGAFSECRRLTSVTFTVTEGWVCDNGSDEVSILATELGTAATAATYLKTTYKDYTWKRNLPAA